jgi:hypothetical protein
VLLRVLTLNDARTDHQKQDQARGPEISQQSPPLINRTLAERSQKPAGIDQSVSVCVPASLSLSRDVSIPSNAAMSGMHLTLKKEATKLIADSYP